MRRTHRTTHAGSRRGQALMVAVLLMMAILLVGILFVALVTYNQSQSERHEETLAAQAMAEAGIRYATYMLEKSPEGADWRPPEPPPTDQTGAVDPRVYGPDTAPGTEDDYYTDMELARGWAPVVTDLATPEIYIRRGFSRFPDPLHPASPTAGPMPTGVAGGYFLLRVSYAPWEPGDPDTPDPLNWHIKIESIGRIEGSQIYREMVAYKPIPMLNYMRFVHNATDHGRPAQLGVPAWADMDMDGSIVTDGNLQSDWLSTTIHGPVRVNGTLEVAGGTWLDAGGAAQEASTIFDLTTGFSADGYLRDDRILASDGIYRHSEPADDIDDTEDRPAEVYIDGTAEMLAYTSDDLDTDADSFDTMGGRVLDGQQGVSGGQSRFVAPVEAGTLTLGDGTTRFERYKQLTAQSGNVVQVGAAGPYVNNGRWGFGKGIYIDNSGDVQFNHDIDALIDDWQRPSAGGTTPTDSGWNPLMTTYAPPAVVVEFLPDEASAGAFETSVDPRDVGSGEVWWPYHEAGQPGIKITRYDKLWPVPEDIAGGPNAGDSSGQQTIVMDYPTSWLDGSDDTVRYPLIVAEGNVRASGQLPPAAQAAGDMIRSYDMTVVSGGTIYIDGQLLAPNDHLTTAVADEFNTKVALLARDCVCLNTTQIVPQDRLGAVPAAPDDPLNPADPNKHWEIAPGSDGRGYSLFFWGDTNIGSSVGLVGKFAAGDPGPSGISLTMWEESTGYTDFIFDPAPPAPMVPETFALVPETTVFPDGVSTPPQPYGVAAIAPQWAPYRDAAAQLPWDLAGYVDPTPGVRNAVVLRHADPHLGAGSTSLWLKKWKIAEYDGGNPVGAINARVNAAVFAERGCWYVLTNGYFDDELTVDSVLNENPALTRDEARARVIENRRYNYKVTFVGTIAENFTASVEAARHWHDTLAYPERYDSGNLAQWGTIEYIFDETLRMARYHATFGDPAHFPTHPAANMPRLPLLPVSPDLVYYGD